MAESVGGDFNIPGISTQLAEHSRVKNWVLYARQSFRKAGVSVARARKNDVPIDEDIENVCVNRRKIGGAGFSDKDQATCQKRWISHSRNSLQSRG